MACHVLCQRRPRIILKPIHCDPRPLTLYDLQQDRSTTMSTKICLHPVTLKTFVSKEVADRLKAEAERASIAEDRRVSVCELVRRSINTTLGLTPGRDLPADAH